MSSSLSFNQGVKLVIPHLTADKSSLSLLFVLLRQRGGSLGTSGLKEVPQKSELAIVTSESQPSSSIRRKSQSSPASPRQQMADGLSPADECVGRAATPSQQEGGGMCLRRLCNHVNDSSLNHPEKHEKIALPRIIWNLPLMARATSTVYPMK
ncbi:hypothetical protein COOONC_19550 [Cooperia oncophora]